MMMYFEWNYKTTGALEEGQKQKSKIHKDFGKSQKYIKDILRLKGKVKIRKK